MSCCGTTAFANPASVQWRGGQRPHTSRRRRNFVVCCAQQTRSAAAAQSSGGGTLDSLSESLKLNAVVESLSRQRAIDDVLNVLQDMSANNVTLGTAALSSVVDLLVSTPLPPSKLVTTMSLALDLSHPSGYASQSLQSTGRKRLPDTGRKMRVLTAGSFIATLGVTVSAEFMEPLITHHPANDANAVLLMMGAALAFDRYARDASAWKFISSGLSQVLSNDPKRAARVDAAHYFAAYTLGLPWVCLCADERALMKLLEQNEIHGMSLNDRTTVEKMLVWLLVGAAEEDAIDGILVESDTYCAYRFLDKVDTWDTRESRAVVEVAYSRACLLVEQNAAVIDKLSELMLRGEPSGECMAFLAREFNPSTVHAL